jgi:hypothetical protein
MPRQPYCFKIHFNIILHLRKRKQEEEKCKPIRSQRTRFWLQMEWINGERLESRTSWRGTKKVQIKLPTTSNKSKQQSAHTMLHYRPNGRGRHWRPLKRPLYEADRSLSRPNSWRMMITLTAMVESADWTCCMEFASISTSLCGYSMKKSRPSLNEHFQFSEHCRIPGVCLLFLWNISCGAPTGSSTVYSSAVLL